MFKRREKGSLWSKIALLLTSPSSWWRGGKYIGTRVLRMAGSPHSIAAGVAAGVFASFTPFIGFHFLLAFALAWLLSGNLIAAAFGTAIGNPLTFPLIWASTYNVGLRFLGNDNLLEMRGLNLVSMFRHLDFHQMWDPFLKAMTVGALPVGGMFGITFYVLTYYSVRSFKKHRRARIERRKSEVPPS